MSFGRLVIALKAVEMNWFPSTYILDNLITNSIHPWLTKEYRPSGCICIWQILHHTWLKATNSAWIETRLKFQPIYFARFISFRFISSNSNLVQNSGMKLVHRLKTFRNVWQNGACSTCVITELTFLHFIKFS